MHCVPVREERNKKKRRNRPTNVYAPIIVMHGIKSSTTSALRAEEKGKSKNRSDGKTENTQSYYSSTYLLFRFFLSENIVQFCLTDTQFVCCTPSGAWRFSTYLSFLVLFLSLGDDIFLSDAYILIA